MSLTPGFSSHWPGPAPRRTGSTTRSAPPRCPGWAQLAGPDSADLVVVGGGYFGLWTALLAKERDPEREVLLLEGETCGHAASGRNGGFCEASLTHGFGNGLARWPAELPALLAMGRENLDGIERTVHEHGIDCDFVRAGSFAVATQDYQVAPLREEYDETQAHGMGDDLADLGRPLRARVDSPTFLAGMHDPDARDPRAGPAGLGAARRLPARRRTHRRAARRSRPGQGRAPGSPCTPGRSGCTPSASYSPPTRTRRCCAGCG